MNILYNYLIDKCEISYIYIYIYIYDIEFYKYLDIFTLFLLFLLSNFIRISFNIILLF